MSEASKSARPTRRMPGEEREQQILRAAVRAFARGGYSGTTTHRVAAVAGVSQPYVLRRFGTKEALFIATYEYACSRVQDAFRAAADEVPDDAATRVRLHALGVAYSRLAAENDLLLLMQHGFMSAADPAMGPTMRRAFIDVYRLVQELTGADAEQARDFLARGMLINTLVALALPDHLDEAPESTELVRCSLEVPDR